MPLKKLAKIMGDAQRDAAIARRTSNDPDFQRRVQKDRRGTLSRYATVKAALSDRARIEKAALSDRERIEKAALSDRARLGKAKAAKKKKA